MKQGIFEITENSALTENVLKMTLSGDVSEIKKSGQFINISIEGLFLRRPISVYDKTDKTDKKGGRPSEIVYVNPEYIKWKRGKSNAGIK